MKYLDNNKLDPRKKEELRSKQQRNVPVLSPSYQQLYWIAALLVVLFIGDRLAGWVLKQLTSKSQFRYSRLYADKAEADILLVGNSRGLIFYQPYIEEITGKTTFNLSYNGLPIDLARVLVQDFLERYPSPETMILDVTMADRINTQLISGFNLYAPYSPRLDSLIHAVAPTTRGGGRFSHLFRYNSEIFQRALFYLNKDDEDWLLDRRIPHNMIKQIDQQPAYYLSGKTSLLPDTLVPQLLHTIALAEQKGVEVHLVINPYYPPFADKIVDLESFKNIIEKATGKRVHNYAHAVTATEGFGDYQHLNKHGARLFLDQLKADGLLNRSHPEF